jgi:hypothetical protein
VCCVVVCIVALIVISPSIILLCSLCPLIIKITVVTVSRDIVGRHGMSDLTIASSQLIAPN